MFTQNWLALAFVATVWIVPAWMGISFFQHNFGIRPKLFLIYYFLGTAIYTTWWSVAANVSLLPGAALILVMTAVGIIIGGPSNTFLFQAVSIAAKEGANPAIPIAIGATSNILVFALTLLMGRLLPQYFPLITFNLYHFIGMLLTIAGVTVFVLAPAK